MRRRDVITLLGGAAVAWPLAPLAQQSTMPVIGILSGASPASFSLFEGMFRQGLAAAGFVNGKNLAFEYRWAEGQFERLPSLATDLIGQAPALIATHTLPAALAAKAATSTIPVLFVVGEDPVKVGLVASLNRPTANITGITNLMNVLGAKRLELASEVAPNSERLGLLVNSNNPNAEGDTKDLQAAADVLGRRLIVLTAISDAEIDAAFIAAQQAKLGALFVNIDPFFSSRRERFAGLAVQYHVPTIYPLRDFVVAGGLMSYGANFGEAWRQCGLYGGKILKGAAPSELPVLQPTKIELVINLKAARALGLEVPPMLLARADEILE